MGTLRAGRRPLNYLCSFDESSPENPIYKTRDVWPVGAMIMVLVSIYLNYTATGTLLVVADRASAIIM